MENDRVVLTNLKVTVTTHHKYITKRTSSLLRLLLEKDGDGDNQNTSANFLIFFNKGYLCLFIFNVLNLMHNLKKLG